LITGGTSGIGKATAELLHYRGYRVMVTGVDNLAAGLPEDVMVVRADARSLPDIDQAMEQARRRFGSLDLLFLNAGISGPGPIESRSAASALPPISPKPWPSSPRTPPATSPATTSPSPEAWVFTPAPDEQPRTRL
jgi:NAD(P)-dependent dehydrogenase (short-subunit alcohol dehydrogenase family)